MKIMYIGFYSLKAHSNRMDRLHRKFAEAWFKGLRRRNYGNTRRRRL